MKKMLFSIILMLTSTIVLARQNSEFPVGKNAFLQESLVKDGKVYGSLEKLTKSHKAKAMRLIGQAQVLPLGGKLKGETKIVIGWVAVQKVDEPSQVVALKEPIVSSFVIPTGTDIKGMPLPLAGQIEDLDEALLKLEAGQIDQEDLKKKRTIKIPKSQKRQVIVHDKKDKPGSTGSKSTENSELSLGQLSTQLHSSDALSREDSSGSRNGSQSSGSRSFGSQGLGVGSFDSSGLNYSPSAQAFKTKAKEDYNQSQNASPISPKIRTEVTEEGCQPRIDRIHERVTIQNRAKKFENEKLVDEGECRDSFELYDIKRDYLCEGCSDIVKLDQGLSFPRYKEYWINRLGERLAISDTIYTDEAEPYHIVNEVRGCLPSIDIEDRLVYLQTQTGYLNKFNTFKMVKDCHRIEEQNPIPIIETSQGCSFIHDFPNKMSFQQKRLVYNLNGLEHIVGGCQSVEPGFAHYFTETGCQRIIDFASGSFTPLYRRKININNQDKIITDECEPGESSQLLATREGCEGQYHHDMVSGKSYIKKRYYIENNGREYVSSCVRTDEFINHKRESNQEWIHDDVLRVSRPKIGIYIDSLENGKITLEEPRVRENEGQVDYTFVENSVKSTQEFYFEGCYRRTKTQSFDIYKRADESLYERLMGEGDPIVSTINECTTRTEQHLERTIDGPTAIQNTRIYKQRIITTYPNGSIVEGPWYEFREVFAVGGPYDRPERGVDRSGGNW